MSGIRSLGPIVKTRCNVATVREVIHANRIAAQENRATALAMGMRDLYIECVNQIIRDTDVSFHVLMMPGMTGNHFTYSMRDEDDLCQDIADILKAEVYQDDCLVVLGSDFLSEEHHEDDVMELVLGDIALHLERIIPTTGTETGWYGKNIGWGAIASVIGASLPMIQKLEIVEPYVEKIKTAAHRSIDNDHRSGACDTYRDQNRSAFEAIEKVCDYAVEQFGGYITLPTTAAEICNIASGFYQDAVNTMVQAPRVVS